MPDAENPEHPAQNFVQLWAQSLSLVMGQIAGVPFSLLLNEVSPDRPAEAGADIFVTVTASGPAQGEMGFRIPQSEVKTLVAIFMQDAAAGDTADGRAEIEELFRQVAGYVATSAKPMLPNLALAISLSTAFTWPPAAVGWISSTESAPKKLAIEWRMSAALETAIVKAMREKPAASAPAQVPLAADLEPLRANAEAKRLGFFLDLDLEVTLCFGTRQMLLKEVLELGPGSVVELDREVQDPADLLLDGKLIARGEIVIVNGNYGLRVAEVFEAPQLAALNA